VLEIIGNVFNHLQLLYYLQEKNSPENNDKNIKSNEKSISVRNKKHIRHYVPIESRQKRKYNERDESVLVF